MSAMSFSARVKNEMSRNKTMRVCCMSAEIYGIFLFSSTFSGEEIRLVTEHEAVAERAKALVQKVFRMDFSRLEITDPAEIRRILEHYGHEESRGPALHLNAAMIEEDHCRDAFIRGAFLAAGSVSNPAKKYHLEILTRHYNLSREFIAMLLDMGFSPKMTVRKSNYMIYFKDSEEIEDFLTKSGATASAITLMEAKVEKDLRNRINRRVNCETANLTKTVDAAQKQIEAIARLKQAGGYDALPDKLKEAAELRVCYPEAALNELIQMAGTTMSRSGLNHRLAKLVELAESEP